MERVGVKLEILLPSQELLLRERNRILRRYPVSTARRGAGELFGSECTPRGRHRIRLKIGAGCPVGTVFVARRPTGEIYTPELGRQQPGRDWILTRILWLTGDDPGFNRGRDCDTLRRFIYIHGTAEESLVGTPVSHGCIRMRSCDILELFDEVSNGTEVHIHG
jgi:lipoprotein-anchoring transpeptidase ErfK/SrfK